MQIICKNDMEFPELLKKEKPIVEKLYVQGNVQNLQLPTIAIVGSRECSPYGIKIAYEFAYQLAKAGLCIASGMAIGIDKYAHLGTLDANGKTIAVLGSGFQHIFPKENVALYHRIIAENGTVITEYEPNVIPNNNYFPKRNRIISGLAMGVLIVEGRYRSGSMITARYTIKQNKQVFCIPNKIDETAGYIPNLLIQNGAYLVMKPQDILEFYGLLEEKEPQKVDSKYQDIYKTIGDFPISINEICKITNKPLEEVTEALCMLELEELIQNLPGNQYIRV